MADAVYTACYLHECFRHCNTVKMLNFAPTINCRGLIYTHENGIVLRPTHHVFDLYANLLGETILDCWTDSENCLFLSVNGMSGKVSWLDAVPTLANGKLALAAVNKHPEKGCELSFGFEAKELELYLLCGRIKDSYNSIKRPDEVTVTRQIQKCSGLQKTVSLPANSITVIRER